MAGPNDYDDFIKNTYAYLGQLTQVVDEARNKFLDAEGDPAVLRSLGATFQAALKHLGPLVAYAESEHRLSAADTQQFKRPHQTQRIDPREIEKSHAGFNTTRMAPSDIVGASVPRPLAAGQRKHSTQVVFPQA